jgi:hypothetical protein
MLRYNKKLAWLAVALALASAWWVLNIEITYERNVRHIPTDFRVRPHAATYQGKA